jgi:hypothetical protein
MGLITRFYGPNAKGSKLTIKEMDDNLYYLQSLGVSGLTYSSDILTITNPTGGTLSVNIGTGPIGNPIYIPSGETVTIPTNTQNFIYGDIVVGGTLLIEENSELIILNGDLYLSGGTLSGSGQTVLVDLPTFNDLITSGNYLNGTLTLSTDNGSDLIINGFYTGSTDVFTTGASYNNGIIYFDTNVAQSAYTVNISSLTGDSNTFITGVTYNNLTNTLVLTDNTNNNFSAYINEFSGLTINGSLSATTLYGDGSNLTGISTQDTFVTGGTYSAGTLTFTNNTGGTFNVTNLISGSIYSTVDDYTSGVTKTIIHNLNTTNILLQLIDTVSNEQIYGTITNYDTNSVDITLNQSLNDIKVVILGVNNFQGSNNLPSCRININGTSGLSNTNNGVTFLVLFNNIVYNTSPSDFIVTNSKIQIVNSGRYMIIGRYSSYDMTDNTDFLRVGVLNSTTSSNGDLGTTIEYLDKGFIGTNLNGEASKGGSMIFNASGGEWIGLNALHSGASGGGGGNQGYPVFDNSLFNQPYLEIIKIGN